MQIPYKLKAAINTYYAFRNYNRTGFFPDGDVKERCCRRITNIADLHRIHAAIVPGTIILKRGKSKLTINGPLEL